MPKGKTIAIGFIAVLGIAATVAVYVIVSGNQVKNAVNELKGWEAPKGKSFERITSKSKKLGQVKEVYKIGDAAVPHLIEAVKSWSPEDAAGAMIVLGMLEAEGGIPVLVDVLKKAEGEGGYAAAASLSMYEGKAASALKELGGSMGELPDEVRQHIYDAMAWSKVEDLTEALCAGLKDPSAEVAASVAEHLITWKSNDIVDPLIEALQSDDEALSGNAARALEQKKSEIKAKQLAPLLDSETGHVVAGALFLMGRMDRHMVAQYVIPKLDDQRKIVAAAAAESLVEMGEKLDAAKVVPLLEDSNSLVVEMAASALKRAKAGDAKDAYVRLLSHKNRHTQKAAAELVRLVKTDPEKLHLEPMIPPLIEMLKEPQLAETAANTLRMITRENALGNSYADWDPWWQRFKMLMERLSEARDNYKKVKEWIDNGEIHDHVDDGMELIDRALTLHDEIAEKNLSKRSYDNECQKLLSLKRRVMTLRGVGD